MNNLSTPQESQEYLEWLKKFDTVKTSDDTFTPPKVYDAVKDWVLKEYAPQGEIIRPFYPTGDYTKENYSGD